MTLETIINNIWFIILLSIIIWIIFSIYNYIKEEKKQKYIQLLRNKYDKYTIEESIEELKKRFYSLTRDQRKSQTHRLVKRTHWIDNWRSGMYKIIRNWVVFSRPEWAWAEIHYNEYWNIRCYQKEITKTEEELLEGYHKEIETVFLRIINETIPNRNNDKENYKKRKNCVNWHSNYKEFFRDAMMLFWTYDKKLL